MGWDETEGDGDNLDTQARLTEKAEVAEESYNDRMETQRELYEGPSKKV